MNNDQRIEFWKTLCSLDGKDLQADQNKLKEKNSVSEIYLQVSRSDLEQS